MCPISDTTGPDGYGEESWEGGNSQHASKLSASPKEIITQANSVPLSVIFKYYGIRLSENNKKTVCPFLKHKGGRENSASFNFFPETNTFWCYGCSTGTRPANFVANMEDINVFEAATKIINLHPDEVSDEFSNIGFSGYSEALMEFSDFIRDFIIQHNKTPKALKYIENASAAFDSLNLKHKLDSTALKRLIFNIKKKCKGFTE